MSDGDRGIKGDREFPATSWSFIRRAQDLSSADYARHMERLAQLYWRPVYAFIRQVWGKNHDDAKDLTQEFFATVICERELVQSARPESGGFRAFLRTAVGRFMVDDARRVGRKKRGGQAAVVPLHTLDDSGLESTGDGPGRTPEQVFDRAWNESVMKEAMERLRRRLTAEGHQASFEVFKRYDYDGDSSDLSYGELGKAVSMTDQQVKKALARARGAFREIVTEIVTAYVDDPEELTVELRALFGV